MLFTKGCYEFDFSRFQQAAIGRFLPVTKGSNR